MIALVTVVVIGSHGVLRLDRHAERLLVGPFTRPETSTSLAPLDAGTPFALNRESSGPGSFEERGGGEGRVGLPSRPHDARTTSSGTGHRPRDASQSWPGSFHGEHPPQHRPQLETVGLPVVAADFDELRHLAARPSTRDT